MIGNYLRYLIKKFKKKKKTFKFFTYYTIKTLEQTISLEQDDQVIDSWIVDS